MMKIAIIGGGFCGLALSWHLYEISSKLKKSIQLTLFDSHGIGSGASGIAAGLLHPFGGAHSKLNRMGREGMEATIELLAVASKSLGRPVATDKNILRLALTDEQKLDFANCAARFPDEVEWLNEEQCHQLYPHLSQAPGIWIRGAQAIDSKLYLQGLWQACQEREATFQKKTIHSLNDLSDFDEVVITTGAHFATFQETTKYPLTIVKGQVLELMWPNDLPPIPFALNSHAYLIMNEKENTCLVGATFERDYTTLAPDSEVAIREIMPKVTALIPALEDATILNCYAGVRAVTPNHLPLYDQMRKGLWILTGMGSKGLLYHAITAKKLAEQIVE